MGKNYKFGWLLNGSDTLMRQVFWFSFCNKVKDCGHELTKITARKGSCTGIFTNAAKIAPLN